MPKNIIICWSCGYRIKNLFDYEKIIEHRYVCDQQDCHGLLYYYVLTLFNTNNGFLFLLAILYCHNL